MDFHTSPSVAHLETAAINAAKQANWPAAIDSNQQILAQLPDDLGALNRLGVAQAQSGQTKEAQDSFKKVLEIDKSNQIAKKHLLRLSHNQNLQLPNLTHHAQFIEEPGRTRVVELHRLASKDTLSKLTVGDYCQLKPKGRYISVETTSGCYIGSLPEDISFNLTKLIRTGNTYSCCVRSVGVTNCTVFLCETHRAAANKYIHSFPASRNSVGNDDLLLDTDDAGLLEQIDAPEAVTTDEIDTTNSLNRTPEEHGFDDAGESAEPDEPEVDNKEDPDN